MKNAARNGNPAAAAGSHPGRERENNEDRVLSDPERGIYAVVDGVGGESGGEIAAQTAVDVLRSRLSRRTTDLDRLIREAIALANKQIWERAQAEPALQGMSCVLTVAVLDGARMTVGHVGDSRLYALRRGEIRKVTRDHSPVGMREDAGEISEADAMRHPRRNEIFRDVGSAPHEPDEEGFIDVHQVPFDSEGAFLICSDGLSDMVPSARILEIVEARAGNPQAAVRELIDAANAAGGKDNISVVLVEGGRYAASLRSSRPASSSAGIPSAVTARTAPPLRGAGRARLSAGERILDALTSRLAIFLYVLGILAALAFLFQEPLRQLAARLGLGGFVEDEPVVLRVGPEGDFRTIADALEIVQPGQTIEVAPGEYSGPVLLPDGVSLVSQVSRGAMLRLPPGIADPAVSAEGSSGARLAGFRIVGSPESPLTVGLRLADSAVEVEDVEIAGASVAGVEIAGADRSSLRQCFIHDNPGTGIIVRGRAVPQLQQNLILRNGTPKEAPRPGIEVLDEARPRLIENRIEENGGHGIWMPSLERAEEIFAFNTFGSLKREQAIRTPPKPGEAPTPAPAPQRPSTGTRRGR